MVDKYFSCFSVHLRMTNWKLETANFVEIFFVVQSKFCQPSAPRPYASSYIANFFYRTIPFGHVNTPYIIYYNIYRSKELSSTVAKPHMKSERSLCSFLAIMRIAVGDEVSLTSKLGRTTFSFFRINYCLAHLLFILNSKRSEWNRKTMFWYLAA